MATVPRPAPPSVNSLKSASVLATSVKPEATGKGTSILTASLEAVAPWIGNRKSPLGVTVTVLVTSTATVLAENDQLAGVKLTVGRLVELIVPVVVTSNRNVLLAPNCAGG